MQTRRKRRLAQTLAWSRQCRGLDRGADNTAPSEPVVVNKPAVELYQTLLDTVSKLQLLQNGRFGDGLAEESTTFLLERRPSAGEINLWLVGTRTKWQELPRAISEAQQRLTATNAKRRQDLEALEAKSAALCLCMEQSSNREQKELSDQLYCVRQMIGKHKAELQEQFSRETLEIEAGVERENCLIELSIVRQPSWSSREKTTVPARSDCLYVFGGSAATGATFRPGLGHTFCYDAGQNRWTPRAELRSPRTHFASTAVGKCLYAIGGVDGGRSLKDVERLDLSRPNARWERLPPLPQPCFGALALALDTRIFLLGGSGDTQNLARVAVLDTTAGVWSEPPSMSRARQFAGGGVLDGRLYVFGGRGNTSKALACAERCSPGGPWSEVARLGVARWGCSAAVLNHQLYALGGRNALDQVLASVERYDPALNVWEEVAPLLQGRKGSGAAVLNNQLYAIGGSERRESARFCRALRRSP